MSAQSSKYTLQQKQEELWRRGVLSWLLHAGQKKMYAALEGSSGKKFVINSSRRLGKSYLLCLVALEQAYRQPNSQIKFAAPNQKAARKIVFPLMKQILETCPKSLRPKFKLHDGVYEFPNGSEIHISGSEMGQVDSLRGQACDLALVDEAGFMSDLEYLVESILAPQTLGRANARIIIASTPPVSPDHAFVDKYMQQAMASGAYARFTIYDNPLLSPDEIEEYKKDAGGEESTTWRREYLAEVVTESKNAIFPEATQADLLDQLIIDVPRPHLFIPITAVDLGYLDYTGILFGYYHFPLAKLVIEDEILINKATSAEIVALILAKEKELWGNNPPRVRVIDGPALVIADMNQTHRFNCRSPEKSDLTANVNRVRIDIAQKRIIIHPRCKNTLSQMRYAVWDKSHSKFSRSSNGGHWDLAAALIYLCKHADRSTNPYPAGYGFDPYTDFGYPRKHANTAAEQFKAMFPFITRQR